MILVVEDDEASAEVVCAVLRFQGYVVEVVFSAPEALARLSATLPDLIIIDYYLPSMDGLTFLSYLRQVPGCVNLPTMFITGASQVDVELIRKSVKERNLGEVIILTKHLESAELTAVVQTALSKPDTNKKES